KRAQGDEPTDHGRALAPTWRLHLGESDRGPRVDAGSRGVQRATASGAEIQPRMASPPVWARAWHGAVRSSTPGRWRSPRPRSRTTRSRLTPSAVGPVAEAAGAPTAVTARGPAPAGAARGGAVGGAPAGGRGRGSSQ